MFASGSLSHGLGGIQKWESLLFAPSVTALYDIHWLEMRKMSLDSHIPPCSIFWQRGIRGIDTACSTYTCITEGHRSSKPHWVF